MSDNPELNQAAVPNESLASQPMPAIPVPQDPVPTPVTPVILPEVAKPRGRSAVRDKIFAHKELRSKVVDFFGEQIEIRQPRLGDILQARDNDSRQEAVIETLIKYAYVPGTDELVFEDSDAETFKTMPFEASFLRVNAALEELSEVNFLDKKPVS